jgi:hypothetical protein
LQANPDGGIEVPLVVCQQVGIDEVDAVTYSVKRKVLASPMSSAKLSAKLILSQGLLLPRK